MLERSRAIGTTSAHELKYRPTSARITALVVDQKTANSDCSWLTLFLTRALVASAHERRSSAHMSASMWILALVALIWALERYSFCYFPLTLILLLARNIVFSVHSITSIFEFVKIKVLLRIWYQISCKWCILFWSASENAANFMVHGSEDQNSMFYSIKFRRRWNLSRHLLFRGWTSMSRGEGGLAKTDMSGHRREGGLRIAIFCGRIF